MRAIAAKEWSYITHSYHDIVISADSALYEEDMDKLVKCAKCSKTLPFGSCYTSRKIHNQYGLGFGVCEDCYENERKEEANAENSNSL